MSSSNEGMARTMKALSIVSRIQNDDADMDDAEYEAHISHMIGVAQNMDKDWNKTKMAPYIDHCNTEPSEKTYEMVAGILARFEVADTYDHNTIDKQERMD